MELNRNLRCRFRQSFFAQLGNDVGELFNQVFFLVYYGKGYTYDAVMEMCTDERLWHIQRLYKQLMDEKKAADEHQKEVASRSKKR